MAGPDERTPEENPAGPPRTSDGSEASGDTVEAVGGAVAAGGAGGEGREAEPIRVRVIESGIIEVLLPVNQEIAGEEARVAGAAVRALANGRRRPVLLVITGVVGVSVEARHAYTGSIAASAFAVVGESPVDRVIAHYLLRAGNETIPAQFFTSQAEAVEWLRQYTSED